MTEQSGADDNSSYDGNTLLLNTTNPEIGSSDYVYISGYEITKFRTNG